MKFSIVVATYNRKDSLKRLIEGVLCQTHQDFELIVVDDGSTDGTKEMMQQYSDPRIRYESLSKNHGTATPARNRGIECMTGEALIIWDSDDYLLPNALTVLAQGFSAYSDIDVVCTSTNFYRGSELQSLPRIPSCMLSATEWFGGKRPQDAEIIAVRRSCIGEVRFEARGIDFMFYAKIIGGLNLPVCYINETCGEVYLESDQLSLTLARKKRNNALSIERAPLLDSFLDEHGWRYLKAGATKKYAGFAFGAAFGYLLSGNSAEARRLMRVALTHEHTVAWGALYVALLLPFGGQIVRRIALR